MLMTVAVVALLQTDPQPRLVLGPCPFQGVPGKAECGTFRAYEDRAKQGRTIDLSLVVLRATDQPRAEGAVFFFAGGPGDAATRVAPVFASLYARVRARRDLVFVDQRGTGGSHTLECTLFDPDHPQSYLGEFMPVPAVRRCRAELEKEADLGLYTTAIAADDVDEVRAALGYDKIDLSGGSYGTRAALVYLRQHGDRVRTVTLGGVAPTTDPLMLSLPQNAQRALDGVLGECLDQPSCRAAFPEIRSQAKALFERLAQAPAEVEVSHPVTGDPVKVMLSRNLAAEAVRYLLYTPPTASLVPAVIHAAAAGDLTPLGEYALFNRKELVGAMSVGMYLSVTCAEDLPFVDPMEAGRLAEGTFLGDYRYRDQRAACETWVRADLPLDYRQPVRSDAPVLLVSGEWDPATPPSSGEEAARHLPNSLHIVVPHAGHESDGLEGADCVFDLMLDFVEQGSVRSLDTSCLSRIRRRPFRTSLPPLKPISLPDSELAALVGSYRDQAVGFDVKLQLANGRLTISAAGREFRLVPVAPDRLRVAGALDFCFLVERQGGRVTSLAMEQAGIATLKLVRLP